MKAKLRISCIITVLLAVLMLSGCASQDARMSEQTEQVGQPEQTELAHYTLIAAEAGADVDYDQAKTILEKRLDEMGYEDYSISAGSSGITLDIAEKDAEILSGLCKKGELYFREGTEADGDIVLGGSELAAAYTLYDQELDAYCISLDFNEQGAQAFAEATERLVGEKISVWFDGECIMAPNVSNKITRGKAIVTFPPDKEYEEINMITAQLNSGMLPFELKIS